MEITHRSPGTDVWPYNWPRDLRRLSSESKEEAARIIATTLKRMAGGDFHICSTWAAVAKMRGLKTTEYADIFDAPGMYHPPYYEDGTGVVGINIALPRDTQVRAWVHELAHHELHIWIPPQLSDASDCYSYGGDREAVRHDIARRVEELVMG